MATKNREARLERRIPAPQHAVVGGKLDLIHHTGRAFVLNLGDGSAIRGVFSGRQGDFDQLGTLWKKDVLVSGTATFRPSGRVLRLEAESIRLAEGRQMEVFSQAPLAAFPPLDDHALRVPQGPRSGVAAIIGRWPGEETDDEVAEALRSLS